LAADRLAKPTRHHRDIGLDDDRLVAPPGRLRTSTLRFIELTFTAISLYCEPAIGDES
jgi:hypothetical protein